jgi:hypothetical protein
MREHAFHRGLDDPVEIPNEGAYREDLRRELSDLNEGTT